VPYPRPGTILRRMEHEETHYDPEKVRRVEFFHEPPGRQHVRVTVEYVTGELKVYVVDRAVLADLLKRLGPPP
jgi:hypothetical protein